MSSPLSRPMPWQMVSEAYAAEIEPMFKQYAARALDRVPPGGEVVDVACGPGTLAFVAAARGDRVCAIDFASGMIDQLHKRLASEPAAIEAQVADGMDLPFATDRFDAAFSMFGLMFFPDRHRGFSELFRVLRPGGMAVVSSWQPMDKIPLLSATFSTLFGQLPASPPPRFPLIQPADYEAEMGAAGFVDIEVEGVVFPFEVESAEAFAHHAERGNAAVVALKEAVGPEVWPAMWGKVVDHLKHTFGDGPQRMEMPAWIGRGRKPG